jgi:fimbrial chaperone protein
MTRGRYLRQAACGLALFLLAATQAWAGAFQVGPVTATLSADRPVAALTVRNTGGAPTVVQLQAVAWSQADGSDTYVPTGDLLATPPIFTLAAGASQVIRVGTRLPGVQGERAYRLYLREVPPPPRPGFKGMRMALEISLPIFVVPSTPIAPSLHWRASLADAGHLRIELSNNGSAHARLVRVAIARADDGASLPLPGKTVYVLPGATHTWLVDATAASGEKLHLTAETESGAIQADLVVAAR